MAEQDTRASPSAEPRRGLLRGRHGRDHHRVTFVELFFDLVFVFAVTQLSHTLLDDLTVGGAVHVAVLLMGVWWVWVYTSWATNWLDPQRAPVRLALFVLMLAGLVLSTSLPQAFDGRALPFALAYVFMQVGRTAFLVWALAPHERVLTVNFQRVLAWFAVSGVLWIAGALLEGEWRLVAWALALAVEYAGPTASFWTPGLGRSDTHQWTIEGAHLAERCGLFVIIALGESVLVTGATFAGLPWSSPTVAAFVVAFVGSVAMWWLYFDVAAEAASERIAASEDPGSIGRLAYTYCHMPLVAGIIVAAVGDELVLAHPSGPTEPAVAAAILGGPALYLVGMLAFKAAVFSLLSPSRAAGLLALAVLALASPVLSPLALLAAANAVLVMVAAWERTMHNRTAALTG